MWNQSENCSRWMTNCSHSRAKNHSSTAASKRRQQQQKSTWVFIFFLQCRHLCPKLFGTFKGISKPSEFIFTFFQHDFSQDLQYLCCRRPVACFTMLQVHTVWLLCSFCSLFPLLCD